MHVVISADSDDELTAKKMQIKNYLEAMELKAFPLRFQQDQVFKSMIPIYPKQDVEKRIGTPIAAPTLAAMYPFIFDAFTLNLCGRGGRGRDQVEFEVQPRVEGESKWSLGSLIRYAVTNIASFTTVPLQLVTFMGMGVFIASVILGIHSLWQKMTGQALEGFTTVILLQLFSSSVIMISLGIIGYYIARIYEEIKGRPRYIIASRVGSKKNEATVCESI